MAIFRETLSALKKITDICDLGYQAFLNIYFYTSNPS